MRRTLLITTFVLILLGIGVAAYFLFFSNNASVVVAPPGSTTLPIAGQGALPVGTTETSSNTGETTTLSVVPSQRLVQISAGPIVPGEIVINQKAGSTETSPDTVVAYVARESGNVFTYSTKTHTITRINNKTIPGIQSATWLLDGSHALVRYLSGADYSGINTYALASTSQEGFFLQQNLSDVAVSSTGILSVASGVTGSVATLSRTDGSHATTVFTTPLTSLRASFAGKNAYLVFSKPSAFLAGDAFLVDSAGRFSRIAGPSKGLVALSSPSGKWVLVSSVDNNELQTVLVNTTTHETVSLPVSTIVDKCVWASDDASVYCGVPKDPIRSYSYPDDWYQGAAHFADRIWKIDVAGRYAKLILDFSNTEKKALDATALALDPLETVLTFVNKNDSSLWAYSL